MITGSKPIDAGGFADVWEGTFENRKVCLKSYRSYRDVTNLDTVFDRVRARSFRSNHRFLNATRKLYREAIICKHLSHPNIVPFVGVYASPDHPFQLVFERMAGGGLMQYLKERPNANRIRLVCSLTSPHPNSLIHSSAARYR